MNFDPNKPFNDLPNLPPKGFDLDNKEILKISLEASEAIGALRAMARSDIHNILHALHMMTPLFVPEAVASSSVENIITTNEQVYRALIEKKNELSPNEKEAINYVKALSKGMEIMNLKGSLATNGYLEIQKILEPSKSGLRKLPGTVLSNPISKKVFYTPPVGEKLIRDLLSNFDNYFNEVAPQHEVYARMAILHYQFEAIHPFYDGNGRTGRMLMPLYLMRQQKLDLPILFISRYILQNRDEYYQKLRAVTYEQKWKEWIIFIIKATVEQAKYTESILEKIQRTVEYVKNNLDSRFPHIPSKEVVDFIFSEAYFDTAGFQKNLKVSYITARKYLHALESSGLVVKKKQDGRNRFIFANPSYIKILKET